MSAKMARTRWLEAHYTAPLPCLTDVLTVFSVAYLPWFWKYVMLIIFSAVYREEREALIQENIARMQAHMGAEGDLWQGMVVAVLPFPSAD